MALARAGGSLGAWAGDRGVEDAGVRQTLL